MSQMFYYCRFLTELDVAGFDTSNVENMSGMFASCIRVKSFNVNGFDTSKVTNMSMMFSEYYKTLVKALCNSMLNNLRGHLS